MRIKMRISYSDRQHCMQQFFSYQYAKPANNSLANSCVLKWMTIQHNSIIHCHFLVSLFSIYFKRAFTI